MRERKMDVRKVDKKYIEAVVANWIRQNTKTKQAHFFPTRQLFEGVDLNYDDKYHMDY